MKSQTIERSVQVQTCATCPFFNSHQGVHGWCGAFDRMAKPCHEQTVTCDQEIAAREKEAMKQHAELQLQPVELLQPTQSTETRYQQGFNHGRADAQAKLYPGYARVSCQYTSGYLSGYNSVFSSQPEAEVVKQAADWTVTYNSRWQW